MIPMDRLRLPHIPVRSRLILAQILVSLVSVLLASASLPLMGLRLQGPAWILFLFLCLLYNLILCLPLVHGIAKRVERMLAISQAWLRGNLSIRINDPVRDDLASLSHQLDLLANHFEQNERDLAELRERNTRLNDQVRELAILDERNRLARDLHDGIKQYLFSLGMTASAIRTRVEAIANEPASLARPEIIPADLIEMVNEVENNARSAQREMTRLIDDLRPISLQETGLAAALQSFILLFGSREHLLIHLDIQGNDSHLPLQATEALYRVAQEALLNVARHAMATRIDITLTCLPEQTILTIHDNGVGFDTSRPVKGLGMTSMQDRMMAVNGRLTITSRPGTGTTLVAETALARPLDLNAQPQTENPLQPRLLVENWSWLGQRLLVPVGQTWPWLPADQVHLRQPLITANAQPLVLKEFRGLFGMGRHFTLLADPQEAVRLYPQPGRYQWKLGGALWKLETISPRDELGRMVLWRNGQPLACIQYHGRRLKTWSEIIYDGHSYNLCFDDNHHSLIDETGNILLNIYDHITPMIEIRRTLPLPLLWLVVSRQLDERNAV